MVGRETVCRITRENHSHTTDTRDRTPYSERWTNHLWETRIRSSKVQLPIRAIDHHRVAAHTRSTLSLSLSLFLFWPLSRVQTITMNQRGVVFPRILIRKRTDRQLRSPRPQTRPELVDATLRSQSKVFPKRGFRDDVRSIVASRPATETILFGTPRRARHASHRHPAARAAGLLRWPGRRDYSACDAATRPTPAVSLQPPQDRIYPVRFLSSPDTSSCCPQ